MKKWLIIFWGLFPSLGDELVALVLNTVHPTVHPGSTHSRHTGCHSSTCFYLNQQCHVKPDCKITKITESYTEMSIQTTDCSLSMSHSDGQNGYKSSQTHTFEWWSVFNPECRSEAPRQESVCRSQILACQQFDLRAVSSDWTASSSSVSPQ